VAQSRIVLYSKRAMRCLLTEATVMPLIIEFVFERYDDNGSLSRMRTVLIVKRPLVC